MLRKYQSFAIELLYLWFRDNPTGNPILELPTGHWPQLSRPGDLATVLLACV